MCLVTGQEAMGSNGKIGGFIWTSGKIFTVSDWMLEQVAHRCCGVSILGDTQKQCGHCSGL